MTLHECMHSIRLLVLLAAGSVVLVNVHAAVAMELSAAQKTQLLTEAQAAFDRGMTLQSNNPTAAKQAFNESTDKYHVLVESGIDNGKLYYNFANACLQSDQIGRAIANYQRAEQKLGYDERVAAGLAYARSLRDGKPVATGGTWRQTLTHWNHFLSTDTRFGVGLAAWIVFWGGLTMGLFWRRTMLKKLLIPAALVVVLAAASIAFQQYDAGRQWRGVVTANSAVLRNGNGQAFTPKFNDGVTEGVEFNVLEQRGRWLHVRLDDGKIGWLDAQQAEVISPSNPMHWG